MNEDFEKAVADASKARDEFVSAIQREGDEIAERLTSEWNLPEGMRFVFVMEDEA